MDIVQAIELLRQKRDPGRLDDIHHLVSIDWSVPAPRPLDPSIHRTERKRRSAC